MKVWKRINKSDWKKAGVCKLSESKFGWTGEKVQNAILGAHKTSHKIQTLKTWTQKT